MQTSKDILKAIAEGDKLDETKFILPQDSLNALYNMQLNFVQEKLLITPAQFSDAVNPNLAFVDAMQKADFQIQFCQHLMNLHAANIELSK